MDIKHELFQHSGFWIVRSGCGERSLQIRHTKKPTKLQLESDYALLDSRLTLSMQVNQRNAKEVAAAIEDVYKGRTAEEKLKKWGIQVQ